MTKKSKVPEEPFTAHIESLTHEGNGVARRDGKTVFVEGALPSPSPVEDFGHTDYWEWTSSVEPLLRSLSPDEDSPSAACR